MDATSGASKANAQANASDADDTPPAELPQVESPSVAPGQSETAENSATDPANGHKVSTAVAIYKNATGASPDLDPTPSLFARLRAKASLPPLAAAIVLTLGMGVLAGSLGIVGVNQLFDAPKDASARETALKDTITQLSTEIDALKAAQAAAVKAATGQMTRLSERLEKAERAQSEPAAKVAKLSETVGQLERRMATSPAPATIPAAAAPPASSVHSASSQADITGAIPSPRPAPAKDISRLPVIPGWVLQRVVDGTAIIYSREGLIEVGVGAALPGGGYVEDIRRLDGRWIVVTSRGLVTMR